jgi:hypothetical protein
MSQTPSLLQTIYPLLAPLPVPMAEHLVRRLERRRKSSPAASWDTLAREVAQRRKDIYRYMAPYVLGRAAHRGEVESRYSTGWLLRTLQMHAPGKKPVPPQTLSYWTSRGLLRFREHGVPDYDSAAALLISRTIDQGERNWLPSVISEQEPRWWCWRQDGPDAPVVACPVPLPANLPDETLLWTPWPGAAWNREWLLVGQLERTFAHLGAIRWAGIKKSRMGTDIWNVSWEALEGWQPDLAPLISAIRRKYTDLPREIVAEMQQSLAQYALQALAVTRLLERPGSLKG